MSDWYTARVLSNRPETPELFILTLDVAGTPLEGTHRLPGQFVKLRMQTGDSFFAIASSPSPNGRAFEFLIKQGTPLTHALHALKPGDGVESGPVQGKGFPVEKARGRNVLLFATGSGISPVRSLILTLVRERPSFGRLCLFFGVRSPDAFAYQAEIEDWRRFGLEITQTVSQPGDSGWQGLTGYVQSHVPPGPLENAVAFLCGQREMVQGVTDALTGQGMPRESVFLNF